MEGPAAPVSRPRIRARRWLFAGIAGLGAALPLAVAHLPPGLLVWGVIWAAGVVRALGWLMGRAPAGDRGRRRTALEALEAIVREVHGMAEEVRTQGHGIQNKLAEVSGIAELAAEEIKDRGNDSRREF